MFNSVSHIVFMTKQKMSRKKLQTTNPICDLDTEQINGFVQQLQSSFSQFHQKWTYQVLALSPSITWRHFWGPPQPNLFNRWRCNFFFFLY